MSELPGPTTDHRYIQVARALRKEIVDGVYPVGSQLPTEHELCQRFSVSRYTVREALRRLREDNLVSSRPRAGTMVVPRPSSHAYVQDVMSINDLLAFATGARFAIESIAMVTIDRELAARTGLPLGEEWLAVVGFRRAEDSDVPICRTEYYINRSFAAVGRMLQNHTGPIFPLLEDLFGGHAAPSVRGRPRRAEMAAPASRASSCRPARLVRVASSPAIRLHQKP